jgi:hypothetical protein
MSRWRSTLEDRVEQIGEFRYIKLETGRRVTFWDALDEAGQGRNKLWRWAARINRLADSEFDIQRYEDLVDDMETFVQIHRTEIIKRRGGVKIEDRIKLLENVTTSRGATKGEQDNAQRAIEVLRSKTKENN